MSETEFWIFMLLIAGFMTIINILESKHPDTRPVLGPPEPDYCFFCKSPAEFVIRSGYAKWNGSYIAHLCRDCAVHCS